ncbi:MAG: VIT1/CCC1 transporter family protein [Methanoregulaceae archaeon]
MTAKTIPPDHRRILLVYQRDEITEREIYRSIARATRDPHNRAVLKQIADEEDGHYELWKRYTGIDVRPDRIRLVWYLFLAKTLGLTFAFRLMENREKGARQMDPRILAAIPEAPAVVATEAKHEDEILGMLDEDRLRYMGSVVLGLNDAIVEFTGALAGFTFALQDSKLIAVTGVVMGVAASLSMGASEYLSQRSDTAPDGGVNPKKAAIYTCAAYVVTVVLLVTPYLLLNNPYAALPVTLTAAILIILCFTYYLSVARNLPFWRRFAEMAAISLGVAAVSFIIGILVRIVLHVNV